MHPVVVGLSRSGGSGRPPLLSLPPTPAAVPATFSALPSLPSAASGLAAPASDSDPDLAQRLRALRRSLRSPQRVLRAAECTLARLDVLAAARSGERFGALAPVFIPTLFGGRGVVIS
jgi:hypothetical protein